MRLPRKFLNNCQLMVVTVLWARSIKGFLESKIGRIWSFSGSYYWREPETWIWVSPDPEDIGDGWKTNCQVSLEDKMDQNCKADVCGPLHLEI